MLSTHINPLMKEYKYKIDGKEYAVKIDKIEGDQAQLEVNGTPYSVEIIQEKKKETPKVSKPTPRQLPHPLRLQPPQAMARQSRLPYLASSYQ